MKKYFTLTDLAVFAVTDYYFSKFGLRQGLFALVVSMFIGTIINLIIIYKNEILEKQVKEKI